ncbi:MAG: HlyD family secretion protein [Bacteroidetes bacterium]|mgnify:FL=1|nr:HlyD family secretion protein [Bacteroidota bacterium]MBX7238114.1 HlyD family secretion protein [Bacteroidia bacterium]MCC7513982.1 HlyD family secretion protein [Bacteroidia bacterium]MCW5918298.1 HlyD family secretion protein [Bacteroidota bacterium]HCI58384.1 HlyD family secretion protein [Bacteroidota bacterium]
MESPEQDKKKFNPLFVIAIVVIAIAAFLGIKNLIHNLRYEITDNAQIEAAGIPVISRISGYVDSLSITDFSQVKEGMPLVSIDSREFILAEQQAEADVQSAEAELLNANAGKKNAEAALQVAQTNKELQKIKTDKAIADYNRDKALFNDGSITQKQIDDSRINMEAMLKSLDVTSDQIKVAMAQQETAVSMVKRAEALKETRKAMLDQAKLRLSYCSISAPATGKIGKCNINIGQFLQAGQTLFTIVNSEKFWVVANFKETQLKSLKEGGEANLIVDGFPDQKITGRIASLSEATGSRFALLPPDNATGNFVKVTQRVPVKIAIENFSEYKNMLRAGMSVTVEVKK